MKHLLDFEKPIVELQSKLDELRKSPDSNSLGINLDEEIKLMEVKIEATRKQIFSSLTPWQRVQLARHPLRPYALDYIQRVFTEFSELHGDRAFADDAAIIGGFAYLNDQRVLVIGTQKGRDTKENIKRNFGSAHPEGYRKALRLMRLADKFNIPIIALIDTAGAYPGVAAEERHIAEAIAVNLREMMVMEVPILALVIGEGGSGGALGLGIADRVLILENAYYSVISPEGCAAILWKDRKASMQAAESLRITAKDLLHFGLVDEILKEPLGGAHQNYDAMCETVKTCLARHLKELLKFSAKKRLSLRYNKFRNHGEFLEAPEPEQDLELEQAAEENKNVAKDDSSNPAPVVADVTDSEDESEVKADSTTVDQDSSQQAKDHAEVGSSELSSKES
jgi:acetyl-CoA carboxylase carboxyl transferase subunit alpha